MKYRCRSLGFLWVVTVVAFSWPTGGKAAEEHPFFRAKPHPSPRLGEMVRNTDMPHQERVDTLNRMVGTAEREDYPHLASWLDAVVRDDTAPLAIREQALAKLHRLGIHPDGLPGYLITCTLDEGEDVQWRMICLSALGHIHGMAAPAERLAIIEAMVAAGGDETAAVAAHANLMLARTDRARATRRGQPAAMLAAGDPEAMLAAMIVDVERGDTGFLPQARLLIADESQPFRVRLAAIRLMEVVGGAPELDVLLRHDGRDELLQSALENARSAIMQRMFDGGGADAQGRMDNE